MDLINIALLAVTCLVGGEFRAAALKRLPNEAIIAAVLSAPERSALSFAIEAELARVDRVFAVDDLLGVATVTAESGPRRIDRIGRRLRFVSYMTSEDSVTFRWVDPLAAEWKSLILFSPENARASWDRPSRRNVAAVLRQHWNEREFGGLMNEAINSHDLHAVTSAMWCANAFGVVDPAFTRRLCGCLKHDELRLEASFTLSALGPPAVAPALELLRERGGDKERAACLDVLSASGGEVAGFAGDACECLWAAGEETRYSAFQLLKDAPQSGSEKALWLLHALRREPIAPGVPPGALVIYCRLIGQRTIEEVAAQSGYEEEAAWLAREVAHYER